MVGGHPLIFTFLSMALCGALCYTENSTTAKLDFDKRHRDYIDYFKSFPIPFFHAITALKLVCRWFCFWLALACAFVFVAIFQGDLAHGQKIQHDITTNYRGDYFTFQLIQNILCFASGLINALCIFDMGMTVSHQSGNTSHTGRLIMIPGVAQRLICGSRPVCNRQVLT